ncbi:NAD(P)H-hydrate dehydratase [Bartonella sp. HY406]|uniref:NAD(P)H-hydrate dehydratase n=1 Tax=Bartonella sp. HY406 TaxID=2979331 RepID=UPI0021C9BE94|nr:NAD(P)H-hydrate dehydratase [Bartonella sp. HY406]UXN04304.1 NAD(P)H-hydrate dehydratase [Bartonella sp. HY406]
MKDHNITDSFLLNPQEMAQADSLTIKNGGLSGYQLMLNAGLAVADTLLKQFPDTKKVAILCGPGNNGGDGYVAAAVIKRRGLEAICFTDTEPRPQSDAQTAASNFQGSIKPIAEFNPDEFDVIVDGLYGAGLDRPISGNDADLINLANNSGKPIVAVDLPSGISGLRGDILGVAIKAQLTVTFFRMKPGHLLYPGKSLAGKVICADIGINYKVLDEIKPKTMVNIPFIWKDKLPIPDHNSHKYSRGHCAVFSGPSTSTGAGRLAAHASARAGAGAVTLLSQSSALLVNAVQLTSVMLHIYDRIEDIIEFMHDRKVKAAVLGPGFGDRMRARDIALELIITQSLDALVLDADGITAFTEISQRLFSSIERSTTKVILTPHEGEFKKLFPEIARNKFLSRLEKAQMAAEQSKAVILYKGADSVIAAPDGRAAINTNAPAYLATAGSGDVLAGLCGGFVAQGMPAFEAACAATYLHSEAASIFGPGLIAEDLIDTLPQALRWLLQPEMAITI